MSVDVNLKQVENALRNAARAGWNMRDVFSKSRRDMRIDQKQHAKDQVAPDGGWPPLAQSTLDRRRARPGRQGRKRRRRSRPAKRAPRMLGRLPRAIEIIATDMSIAAKSRVKWSGIHKWGGVAGHGARIPPRDFLWASRQLMITILRRAGNYVVGAFKGEVHP